MEPCRSALAAQGFACEQPSGACVFVAPDEFESVREEIENRDLKPFHVVVSREYEQAVMDAVASLPSKAQVREKQRTTSAIAATCATCQAEKPRFTCQRCHGAWYCSRKCQQQDWRRHKAVCSAPEVDLEGEFPIVVKRTFLEVTVRNSLRSSPSSGTRTKSTTDADPRKGVRPRRA